MCTCTCGRASRTLVLVNCVWVWAAAIRVSMFECRGMGEGMCVKEQTPGDTARPHPRSGYSTLSLLGPYLPEDRDEMTCVG